MSSKYDKVEQLYRQLIPRLSRADYWDKMLRQIAPFWKLANFTEGMLLTEQLPNATAVASFEQWKKMGRFVKFREKSVLIFASEFDTEVKYLFDISQTYGNAITPKWEMNERLANSIITKYNTEFGENVTKLQSVISKSLDKKLVCSYNYICKGIPSAATDSRVRQLIYDSAKVICMTRCGIDPSEIKADFSNIELLKKEISRIEIGNAGFELAKQVLREIDRMVRSEINERNNDENDVRGRHLRDSLHGEERGLLREDGQLRQEGHERTGSESPRYDGGAGQDGSSVHQHERAVSDDMGGNRSESGEQPQRNAGGAETENTVQPEHRDERAAADGDIHSGAELGMGYNQELRELADSGVSVEEHDSGAEYDKLAYASITLDDAFVVHGLTVINGREGLFVSMPQQSYVDSEGEKKYSDTAFPLSKDLRDSITSAVIKAYRQKLRENAAENSAENAAHDYSDVPAPGDADAPPENTDYDMPEPF